MSAEQLNFFCIVFGGISWTLGFMTGSNNGVSIAPLLVSSVPILASRSLSRISKDIDAASKTYFNIAWGSLNCAG